MDGKIIVATHKKYWMPEDKVYLPLHVGAQGKEGLGYQRDDVGVNISSKNKNYCELTGLYWAWQNLESEYIGLVHYRRHFIQKKTWRKSVKNVITGSQLCNMLEKADVVLPSKRNYFIESTYDQYVHAHHKEDLDFTREILEELYPQYVKAFDLVMRRTSGHRFNMFVMKRDKLNEYCEWLFSILFELEKRLDISDYNPYDQRVFGFVSERLLDVWIETNQVDYVEVPYMFLEKQNWLLKGAKFLKRKFFKSKCK